MARIFFLAILFYLVYKLVFDLILPIYKTTRQVRRQFSDMHNQQGRPADFQPPPREGTSKPSPPSGKAGDYIDFEELK